ncbi:MAG TPA: SDR family oxidoreductase [Dehalococcoidia bacterium]|nr:SDR family oxidoreductase [Dehalococcoidia bacterium]
MRALVLGAETPAGRALAVALAESGAQLALVASTGDAETAFAVQRLARRLGALSQAIDATNEMAVRVMVRQVSKALGGLDAVIFCADLGAGTAGSLALACRFAAREMARAGGAIVVALPAGAAVDAGPLAAEYEPKGVRLLAVDAPAAPDEAWARDLLARLTHP